jgi:hypothetical protein
MAVLVIEYRVEDFEWWKGVFDRDPLGRKERGWHRALAVSDARRPEPLPARDDVPLGRRGGGIP